MNKQKTGWILGSVGFVALTAGALWVADAVFGRNPVAAAINGGHVLVGAAYPWRLFWVAAALAALLVIPVEIRHSRADNAARSYQFKLQTARDEWRYAYDADERAKWQEKLDELEANPVTPPDRKVPVFVTAAVVVLLLAGLALSVRSVNRHGHDVAHDAITAVLTVEEDAVAPSYLVRDPYDIAANRLRRSVGDASGYSVNNVWRFEVDGEFLTCGLKTPEANKGRRPMGGVVCVTDAGKVIDADFDGEVPTWDYTPMPGRKAELRLAQVVNEMLPRGAFTTSDVYGYVEDGKPVMVVPVTRRLGGAAYHRGWIGAIVFDADGNARVETDASALPGPVVGESVADEVLDAIGHRGGFMESKRAAFAYDLGDGANVKHFLLERADGSGERLVTLLTPKGNSETVTAILEINPHEVVGGWPTATLYRLTDRSEAGMSRASVDEVIDLVRQRYGTAMQLAESRQDVLEATPADPNELVVTIGSNQRVFARVSIDMIDRSTCVYAPDGDEVRCDGPDAAPLPLGALRELYSGEGAPGTDTGNGDDTPVSVLDVTELSDAELAELLRDVADELDARAKRSTEE